MSTLGAIQVFPPYNPFMLIRSWKYPFPASLILFYKSIWNIVVKQRSLTYKCLRSAILASWSMRLPNISLVVLATVVGRCRTPSGRFSGGNGFSFFSLALSLMSLVACSLGLFECKARWKHLNCSGWPERNLRIGHGENIDICEGVNEVLSHDPINVASVLLLV